MVVRKYIRHPVNIPIEFQLDDFAEIGKDALFNVSFGGFCFQSAYFIEKNSLITIRIPDVKPEFRGRGVVIWCQQKDALYEVGVKFLDHLTAFRIRMIEQICHIENYRKAVFENEGRTLNGRDAAQEWIRKYAKDFPRIHELLI